MALIMDMDFDSITNKASFGEEVLICVQLHIYNCTHIHLYRNKRTSYIYIYAYINTHVLCIIEIHIFAYLLRARLFNRSLSLTFVPIGCDCDHFGRRRIAIRLGRKKIHAFATLVVVQRNYSSTPQGL